MIQQLNLLSFDPEGKYRDRLQLTSMPDICFNNHCGNVHSTAAHKAVAPSKQKQLAVVLQALKELGQGTCEQVEIKTGMKHQTCSARFSDLKRLNKIVFVGQWKTLSGCSAGVWRVATDSRLKTTRDAGHPHASIP